MAQTPQTTATSYLSVAELLKRCDWRTLGDLVSDTGARVTQQSLSSDPNLAALLLDASGMLESACSVANRYLPADLAAIVAGGGAGAAYLYRLLTGLVIAMAIERRPELKREMPAYAIWALEQIDLLRQGERILSTVEAGNAGLPEAYQETAGDVEARNLSTYQCRRFFGRRANVRGGPLS